MYRPADDGLFTLCMYRGARQTTPQSTAHSSKILAIADFLAVSSLMRNPNEVTFVHSTTFTEQT